MATTTQREANLVTKNGPEIAIVVQEVHKYYDLGETRVHALRGVSIEIARGEFVAIMGASGGGKSTFMNILGCLDKPSAGRYLLEGIEVRASARKNWPQSATTSSDLSFKDSICSREPRP